MRPQPIEFTDFQLHLLKKAVYYYAEGLDDQYKLLINRITDAYNDMDKPGKITIYFTSSDLFSLDYAMLIYIHQFNPEAFLEDLRFIEGLLFRAYIRSLDVEGL